MPSKTTQKTIKLEPEDAKLVLTTLEQCVNALKREAQETRWQTARENKLMLARDLERIYNIIRRA